VRQNQREDAAMRMALTGAALALMLGGAAMAAAPAAVIRTDHYVAVKSTAPGMTGADARLYVREVSLPRRAGPSKGVVLFVHGAGTPAEVAFDVPHGDYSWMAYLAREGFDVFSMDMEGYGRSTRPPPMADACNAPAAAQAQFVPKPLAAPCPASIKGPITHMGSDWNDIDAVVDHLLKMKGAKQLSLVAWSQGGPRSGGYAIAHPDKVKAIVALAPAYIRDMPAAEPSPLPAVASPLTTQSQAEFKAGWDRQATCPGQYDPAVAASVWSEMLQSDPVGAGWGPGVRRAPSVPSWGFNKDTVPRLTTPYLMVAGLTDAQVSPALVRNLYADIGSKQKVLIELACASHNAMWEKPHLALFKASAEFLATGKVNGVSSGVLKLGE
jgi:pimeloyl-ACP methyl ester carboxylesterase